MCYNPIKVNYHDSFKNYRGVLIHPYNKGRIVNCGSCLECREQYIENWQIRWMEQLKCVVPDSSYMLTLTYNDLHLPHIVTPDGELKSTLNYTDVQKFIKRLRKKQDTYCKKNNIDNPSIKYHGCGEYGKNFTKRPHYHILITNLIIDKDLIQSIWGKGMVHIGDDVTPQTINYILKYTLKVVHSKYKPKKFQTADVCERTVIPFSMYDYDYGTFNSPYYGELPFPKSYGFRAQFYSNTKTHFKYYPKGAINEYRISEKSFCSKGIGKEYLTPENIEYHLNNPMSTYDYYDHKKAEIKQKPLPRYYYEQIYNPIKKIDGKNQYDDNKRPIRQYDKKDMETYVSSPMYERQVIQYNIEQEKLNQLLKKYGFDMHLLVLKESKTRKVRKNVAIARRDRIIEHQRYNNYVNNLELI